jgi:tetratricopeptide (TPR) repeat protein
LLATADRQSFKDAQELCDVASQHESDPLRRQYLYCRGIDTFPDEPAMLQQYGKIVSCSKLTSSGDFLVDRPDMNGTWDVAQGYYSKALAISEKDSIKHKKSLLFTLYRYALFLANNRCDYIEADKLFRQLLRKLPGSAWVFERYAEFLSDYRHKFALAEKMYRMILNMQPTGSSLISYALFLWQVRRNYTLAGKCFRVSYNHNNLSRERDLNTVQTTICKFIVSSNLGTSYL